MHPELMVVHDCDHHQFVGLIKQLTHSFAGGLLALVSAVLAAGLIALTLPGIEPTPAKVCRRLASQPR